MTEMQSGERKVGPCKLRIRQPPSIPGQMRTRIREIVDLETPAQHQGKGFATTLMHRVCQEADRANFVLILTPQPFGNNIAMSKQYLINWYAESFGFQVIQEEPTLMARMPGATPKMLALKPGAEAAFILTKASKP